MSTQPTDVELKAMWQLHAADIGGIFCYARAVLAKWGQPAQAQAVSMTSRQISDTRCAALDPDDWPEPWAFTQGVRAAEKRHSIKGGQHGTE